MRTHVFLTPATQSNPGELVEVQFSEDTRQLYAEPVPYFDAVAVASPSASVQELQKKQTAWDAFLSGLDMKNTVNLSATTCCSGKYLCTKCQAKTIA